MRLRVDRMLRGRMAREVEGVNLGGEEREDGDWMASESESEESEDAEESADAEEGSSRGTGATERR
jgi:hypothetical protein